MTEKTFTISGTYKEKKGTKKFTKQVSAVNENYAKEKALSEIGSKHQARRHFITIQEIKEAE